MKTQAIIVAAGLGTRLNLKRPKALVSLCGRPLFVYCLQVLEKSRRVDSVVLVAHQKFLPAFFRVLKKYRLKKVSKVVAGGQTRFQSVKSGLKSIDKDTDIVLIHDAARPLVTTQMIDESIKLCYTHGAVVAAVPVKPTIKRVEPRRLTVKGTLNREELWEVQTPQVFRKDILEKTHRKGQRRSPTDDAVLAERLGIRVHVIQGDYKNIKVTTQDDLTAAQAFLRNGKQGRII